MQRLEDGRIVETWVSWDNVAFLTQLGHMLDREPSPPPTAVTRSLTDVHRVVTGRSPLGEVAVVSEGTAPGAITFDSLPGFELLPLWATSADAKIPDDGRALQPAPGPILPRPEETRFLLLRLPAQREIAAALEAGSSMESFGEELAAQVPELAAARHPENPLLHVTDSVDYVVVLTGEVVLELDGGTQARIHPGDVVIQNGVPHAWHAAGPEGAVLAAVMVGCRR